MPIASDGSNEDGDCEKAIHPGSSGGQKEPHVSVWPVHSRGCTSST
jgi:hypothetical protein